MEPWQAAATCLAAACMAIPVLVLPGGIAGRFAPGPFAEPILSGSLGAIAGVLLFVLLAQFVGVPPRAWFLRYPDREALIWILVTGIVVAPILATAFFVAPDAVTVADVGIFDLAYRILAAVAIGLWTGIVEEFLLRGVVLSILGHQWHWPGAILVTALAFGLLHQGGGETVTATALYVGITTVAGILFGLIVVLTGNIWNAVAFHATWNAVFAGFLVGFDPSSDPSPLVALASELPWMLAADGAVPPESPLALLLLTLLLCTYWLHVQQNDPATTS